MVTALLDGDILRYEIGYAAETGWKSITGEDELPPFDYISQLLDMRIQQIRYTVGADNVVVFLTEGDCFRNYIAKSKPYKGQRVEKKPWHYKNICAHMKAVYPVQTVTWIEADDAMAIAQTSSDVDASIVCTRDKDLRQVPGLFFSWELGNQPQIGPLFVTHFGHLEMLETQTINPKTGKPMITQKLFGTGFKWFCAQILMGDTADNIPGLNKYGPIKAYNLLVESESVDECLDRVIKEYKIVHGDDWEQHLLEQGQLLWIVRELDKEGKPVVWQIGMS